MIGFDAPMVSVSLLLANGGGGGEGSREGNVGSFRLVRQATIPAPSLLPKGAPAPSLVETGVMVLPVRLRDPVKPAASEPTVTTGQPWWWWRWRRWRRHHQNTRHSDADSGHLAGPDDVARTAAANASSFLLTSHLGQ